MTQNNLSHESKIMYSKFTSIGIYASLLTKNQKNLTAIEVETSTGNYIHTSSFTVSRDSCHCKRNDVKSGIKTNDAVIGSNTQ